MKLKSGLSIGITSLFLSMSSNGQVAHTLEWNLEDVALSSQVRIETDPLGRSGVELLHLPDGTVVAFDSRLSDGADYSYFEKLSSEQKAEFQRARHDMILATARLGVEDKLGSVSIVNGQNAASLQITEESLRAAPQKITPLVSLSEKEVVKGRKEGRLRSVLRAVNEAIVLSTYRAARHYWENRKDLKGLTNEFGIQITLKGEFQVGFGKLNITKNFPLVFSIGYRKDTREVLFRMARRREVMSGGTAFSAGLKVELRKYSRVSLGPSAKGTIEGVTWYPPSIPFTSFVGDTSSTYRSGGLVFGVNLADAVPGLYFVNTVNDFSDQEYFVKSVSMSREISVLKKAVQQLSNLRPGSFGPIRCQDVFAVMPM